MTRATMAACALLAMAAGCDKQEAASSKEAGKADECPKPKACGGGIAAMATSKDPYFYEAGVTWTFTGPGADGKTYRKGDTAVFARGSLPKGKYTVTVTALHHLTETRQVQVDDGYIETVRVRLKPSGYAQDDAGKDIDKLVSANGEEVTSRGGFPVGDYRLPDSKDVHVAIKAGEKTIVSSKPTPYIVVGGKKFALDDDVTLVRWDEPGGFDFPGISAKMQAKDEPRLLAERIVGGARLRPTLSAARTAVQMVVLHTDLKNDSKDGFEALIKAKLSSHFMIDFDGTIYQGMDLAYQSFHAGDMNPVSVSIDLNNLMKNAADGKEVAPFDPKHPRAPELAKHPRKMSALAKINGGRVKAFGYTDAQYRSLASLLRALTLIFPRVAREFPKDADDKLETQVVAGHASFEGIAGHLHTSATRWDPGPGLDWDRLIGLINK